MSTKEIEIIKLNNKKENQYRKLAWGCTILTVIFMMLGLLIVVLFSTNILFGWLYIQEKNQSESASTTIPTSTKAPENTTVPANSTVLPIETLELELNSETLQNEFTIEFGSSDYYSIQIVDGMVSGGYAQGSARWDVLGGSFDGANLQVVFVTSDRSNCNQWWSHNFQVEPSQVILRTSVNKCGEVIADRNVVYPRHQ